MSLKDKLSTQGSNYNPVVRTNAYNIPGGQYVNIKATNLNDSEYSIGGPIKNLKGNIVNNTLNQWDENLPYLSQFNQPFNLDSYYSEYAPPESPSKFENTKNKINNYLNNVKDGASNALSDIGDFFSQQP
jgi:hypothetical protein